MSHDLSTNPFAIVAAAQTSTEVAVKVDMSKPAAVSVAELAREQIAQIRKTFVDAISDDRPISIRLKGAQMLVDADVAASKLQQDREIDELSKAQLVESIVEMMGDLQRAGILPASTADEDIVEAEVVGDEQ